MRCGSWFICFNYFENQPTFCHCSYTDWQVALYKEGPELKHPFSFNSSIAQTSQACAEKVWPFAGNSLMAQSLPRLYETLSSQHESGKENAGPETMNQSGWDDDPLDLSS